VSLITKRGEFLGFAEAPDRKAAAAAVRSNPSEEHRARLVIQEQA